METPKGSTDRGQIPEDDDSDSSDNLATEQEDITNYIRNEQAKLKSAKAKAEFFSGIRMQTRVDSIEVRLQIDNRAIIRDGA